jgi:signal peptidase I
MAGPALPAPARGLRGRVTFWLLFAACVLAWVGGVVTVVATTRVFTVPSTSMENTIRPGDRLLVDRTTQVRRGDVIVEQQRQATYLALGDYVRRVIGLPGDHVVCCNAAGHITVDGKPLDETYLYPGDAPSVLRFNVIVPRGKLFLLGDHRSVALDSQRTGPVAAHVIGRVFAVIRGGHLIFLRTPPTFVADGLAPRDTRVAPALIGLAVSGAASCLIVVLAIVGITRYAIRRRRARGQPLPAAAWLATGPPPSDGSAGL